MKKILITGGAGFIGSNLALKLINRGYLVTILDNLSTQIHGENPIETSFLYRSIFDKVNFIKGDVTNRSDWTRAMSNQDVIIHLAAETGTGQSMCQIEKYININIGGTSLMLDILTNEKHSIKKVIVASSRAIYGEGKYLNNKGEIIYPGVRDDEKMKIGDFDMKDKNGDPLILAPTDEDSKIAPTSVYGITKQSQEQLVMTVCSALNIPAVAFRYQNVYGPGQSLSNPYTGILSIFSTRIKNGNSINIFEDGRESRDFVYIDDVVEATILGLEKKEANGIIFNVGSGVAVDVLTVAKELMKNYKADVPLIVSGDYRLGDIRHNYADLKKINKYLGFVPSINFFQGIKLFTNWVNTQDVKNDYYEKSILELKEKGLYRFNLEKKLNNKKILFIAPKFYGYEKEIINELGRFGASIKFFSERPNFLISGILSIFSKFFYQKFKNLYLNKIVNKTKNDNFDYIFLIRGNLINTSFLEELKKNNKSAKFILYLWDSLENNDKSDIFCFFDDIFTFDIKDSEVDKNLKYLPLFYCREFAPCYDIQKSTGLLFVGSVHSSRYNDLMNIKKYCKKNDIIFYHYLYIPFFSWLKQLIFKNKNYSLRNIKFKKMKRAKLAELINRSNAVLDLHNCNQSGLTMRTMETLASETKLITTNLMVASQPFYSEKNIRFLDLDNINIDKDFIKSGFDKIDFSAYSLSSWLKKIFL